MDQIQRHRRPGTAIMAHAKKGTLRVTWAFVPMRDVSASRVLSGDQPSPRAYSAIWDTGATVTSITERVVQECGLAPIGVTDVAGVHGTQKANIYLIDVYLPNAVAVEKITATEMAFDWRY